MIHIKTKEEVKIMRKSGKILSDVLGLTMDKIKPGVTEIDVDKFAESQIISHGGTPGFKKVPGYKHTVCVATNDVVVHGIPTTYKYQEGDLACIDCGVYLNGFHTDMAETIIVPGDSKDEYYEDKKKFLDTGKRALLESIKQAKAGNRVGDISKVIQDIVEVQGGYSIVRNLVGHGVGRDLHEEPEVPGFLNGKIEKTPLLKPGMVIAIEIIYNMGKPDVEYAGDDGWTISSADGSLSAVFERTVLIADSGPEVLTPHI